MCDQDRQQFFDTAVAEFTKKLISFGFISTLEQLDEIIESVDNFKDALTSIRNVGRAGSYPGDTKIRFGAWKPFNRNAMKRGGTEGVPAVRGVEDPKPLRRPYNDKLTEQIEQAVCRLKKATSVGVAKLLGLPTTKVTKVLRNLKDEGKLKRRKAKESEKDYSQVRYIYEVAA